MAPRAVYIFAGCAALNSCNLGYDIGVSTDVGLEVQETMNLTDVQTELFMGSINIFGIIGALVASFLSDWVGRRKAFAISAVGFVLGVLSMAAAQTYFALMIGRAVVGVGVGFGLAVDPVYIAEISPAAQRGRLVTWSEISINIGLLLGFSTGYAFSGLDRALGWRVMLGCGGVLPCVMLLLVWRVMPESPRWLIQNGRVGEARPILEAIGESDVGGGGCHRAQHSGLAHARLLPHACAASDAPGRRGRGGRPAALWHRRYPVLSGLYSEGGGPRRAA
jgi:MFS family permease